MNGGTARRIRKLMLFHFKELDVYIKSKKVSKTFKAENPAEELSWNMIYRNTKKLYVKNENDRIFFETLMKKENI